jgi:general secretion pathway protein F
MPAYSFTALDEQGQSRKGTLEADSAKSARAQLRAQAFIPLSVLLLAGGTQAREAGAGADALLWRSRVFNSTALAIWTRQLAELVRSGLPLEQALGSLSDEAENEAQRNLNAALRASVNGGTSLARALEQHPREFADIYVAVVGAGEQSGQLALVLQRLAEDLEERQNLRSKLLGAILYPAFVSLVALVIVLFLVGYVVPQVAHVFAGSKHALPFLTVAMMAISDLVRGYGWLAALLLAAAGALLWQSLKNPLLRERWDAAWLNLPLLGKLARGYNAARFAGTLSMLSAAGVPILQALQAAAHTLGNQALKHDALDALALVREGAPLAAALAQKKAFPRPVVDVRAPG